MVSDPKALGVPDVIVKSGGALMQGITPALRTRIETLTTPLEDADKQRITSAFNTVAKAGLIQRPDRQIWANAYPVFTESLSKAETMIEAQIGEIIGGRTDGDHKRAGHVFLKDAKNFASLLRRDGETRLDLATFLRTYDDNWRKQPRTREAKDWLEKESTRAGYYRYDYGSNGFAFGNDLYAIDRIGNIEKNRDKLGDLAKTLDEIERAKSNLRTEYLDHGFSFGRGGF